MFSFRCPATNGSQPCNDLTCSNVHICILACCVHKHPPQPRSEFKMHKFSKFHLLAPRAPQPLCFAMGKPIPLFSRHRRGTKEMRTGLVSLSFFYFFYNYAHLNPYDPIVSHDISSNAKSHDGPAYEGNQPRISTTYSQLQQSQVCDRPTGGPHTQIERHEINRCVKGPTGGGPHAPFMKCNRPGV